MADESHGTLYFDGIPMFHLDKVCPAWLDCQNLKLAVKFYQEQMEVLEFYSDWLDYLETEIELEMSYPC